MPGKAIKLSFSPSPQTLSPSFYSATWTEAKFWHQRLWVHIVCSPCHRSSCIRHLPSEGHPFWGTESRGKPCLIESKACLFHLSCTCWGCSDWPVPLSCWEMCEVLGSGGAPHIPGGASEAPQSLPLLPKKEHEFSTANRTPSIWDPLCPLQPLS